ncbi:MAG: hypothetical protein FJ144_10145 [Deltaproteobacteria bacterium]|nr:hypothetical protein [Deltaproteobacteria bacterium]
MTGRGRLRAFFAILAYGLLRAEEAAATTYVVAASGGDFTSIQAALDVAEAGDTIQVREKSTPYFEKVEFQASGNAVDGFLSLEAYPGEQPILDGTGAPGANMVLIEDRSWVRLSGFVIRNNLGVNDGSGVRILGAGSHVEIRDNEIHDIRGRHAMGITVYATKAQPISDLVIDGNHIHDCEPATSEALTLNGNVTDFAVTNNVVEDVNNIAIDFIGGETDIQPDPTKVARNGVCRGNVVRRARSSYGGGFAGGIYVDGGRDIVIENNVVTESDLGIEIGAENAGLVTSGIVVRSNLVYANDKVGIVFGGFSDSVGTVEECELRNNTLYGNDTLGEGFGEIWVQYAENNVVRNNVFFATEENLLLASYGNGNQQNDFDHNVWWTADGAASGRFIWNDVQHVGFTAYRNATGQDASSLFVDPLLVAPEAGDFHVDPQSPAVNAGDPSTAIDPGEADLDGAARLSGPRVDAGADEITCGDGEENPGEECDDGNLIDGDGCDSNCTFTACGNGIVTSGEVCDDGNVAAGDCCGATCQLEANGAPCDDARLCTRSDACSVGVCVGAEEPEPSCRTSAGATVTIRASPLPLKRSFGYVWKGGAATTLADLGDPTVSGGTRYDLCLFDRDGGVSSLVLEATLPAGGTCGGKVCWSALGGKGFKYGDKNGASGGITKLLLKTGAEGKAKLLVKGRGAGLDLPELPLDGDPSVGVEVRNDEGVCFGTTFAAPADNDGAGFKDKTP